MYNLLESQYFSVRSQEGENRQLGILLLLSFFPIGVWLLFPLLVMSLGINDTFASDSHSLMPALYEGSPSALSFEYFASRDFSWSLGHTSPFYGRSVLGFLWKDWCWSWNSSILATSCEELTHWKRPESFAYAGRDGGQEEKGTTEHEMAGWHHRLDGRESEWTPGDGDGQGGLACCDSWGRKESDTTAQLN